MLFGAALRCHDFLDVFLEACWKNKVVVGGVNVSVYVVVCTQSLHFISSQQVSCIVREKMP
jgi:hypothetical protein